MNHCFDEVWFAHFEEVYARRQKGHPDSRTKMNHSFSCDDMASACVARNAMRTVGVGQWIDGYIEYYVVLYLQQGSKVGCIKYSPPRAVCSSTFRTRQGMDTRSFTDQMRTTGEWSASCPRHRCHREACLVIVRVKKASRKLRVLAQRERSLCPQNFLRRIENSTHPKRR